MQLIWETTPEHICVGYEDKILHIKTDQALKDYLDLPGRGAAALAMALTNRYQQLSGVPLEISEDSVAVEILVHAYLDVFAQAEQRLAALLPDKLGTGLAEWSKRLQAHTCVIDIGERSVDTNRRFFDALAPYHEILYAVLGRKA